MKILIISLLKRNVTPTATAARPRMIYEIVKGLLQAGHEVDVLATGDSEVPGADIIPVIPHAFVDMPVCENPFYAEISHLVRLAKKVEQIADKYDIIHNHTYPEFINLLTCDHIKTPLLTTIHAQATRELDEVLSLFKHGRYISISNSHKKGFVKTPIFEVVHNGIDTDIYSFCEKKQDYLLWIGRLSKAKNTDGSFMDPKGIGWAIKVAQKTDMQLKLAGNVEDINFFNTIVKPNLNGRIQWVGEVSSEQKLTKDEVAGLMQNAKAFMMTVNWEEPFGLVMTEAMSCGTPVIGFDRGAVGEIVINGKTGFVVDPRSGVDGLVQAIAKLPHIRPQECRKHVEQNYSVNQMIKNYERVYTRIINLGS